MMEFLNSFAVLVLLLFLGMGALAMLAIPYVLLYLVHTWLLKKGYGAVGKWLYVALTVYLGYSAYTAIYPTDSFYFSEFTKTTLRDAPESASVIRSDASYPDFHGDYCSAALIGLSKDDYESLLQELTNDSRLSLMISSDLSRSDELDKVLGNKNKECILQWFTRKTESGQVYIGFLDDNQSIVISVWEM